MSPIELFWTAKKPCYRFPKVDDWRKDSNASSQWDRNMISLWNKSKWQASQIWGNQCEIQMLVFNEKEIWFHCKTNPYDWFPKFEAVGESPFNFEGVFRHFVMNFSDSFWLQTSFKAYGRANPSKKVSCNQFSLSWSSSKISHPLQRGCRSRLSICQSQPK